MNKLLYVIDPMCSWCWAFSDSVQNIAKVHPDLELHYLMGGLAPDSDEPMPVDMQQGIQSIWHQIADKTGTRFNYDFWTRCQPRRSTWRACRAVLTTRHLAPGKESSMIRAIQEAYYLNAQNPSDRDTLIEAAQQIGLDTKHFSELLDSDEMKTGLEQDMSIAGQLGARGFPAVRLIKGDKVHWVSDGYLDESQFLQHLETALKQD